MTKLSFREFKTIMQKHTKDEKPLVGYIVFDPRSFTKEYSLDSRTYRVTSDEKYFNPEMCGNSLWGYAKDGSDDCVRLNYYLHSPNPWIVEYCYLEEEVNA